MTDLRKKLKNAASDAEAETRISEDHAEGKPSSEMLNNAKVRVRE
jgi:hypothetical protein